MKIQDFRLRLSDFHLSHVNTNPQPHNQVAHGYEASYPWVPSLTYIMRTTLAAPHIMLTFQDGGSYLGSNPTLGPPALHRDDVVSLLHRVNDSGSVNWANGAEVDHFTAHALSLQLLSCLKSCTHLTGVSHQSEMRAWRGGERRGEEGRGGERRGEEGRGGEGREGRRRGEGKKKEPTTKKSRWRKKHQT